MRWTRTLGVVLGLCGLLALGGCVSPEAFGRAYDGAVEVRERRAAEVLAIEGVLSRPDLLPADRAELEARLAEARALHGAADAAVRRADQLIAETKDPQGPISQAVELVAPWVPEPARAPLVLGAAAAGVALRSLQWRRGLVSVIEGLDRAMKEDGAFAEQFRSHAALFRSSQTALARRVVDDTVRRRRKPSA
ncbi:MAG: hypothetical protein EA423_00745 [Phycisphaerales bacterium]|nr:MAG: hypothetical protein EA423_00745 [Phycisphaerales bacterium]